MGKILKKVDPDKIFSHWTYKGTSADVSVNGKTFLGRIMNCGTEVTLCLMQLYCRYISQSVFYISKGE